MDLNVMMREQALAGLNAELETAVTNGDAAAAKEVTKKISALAVASAPKAPPFGDAEIRAELDKQAWFGTDPKKSAKAVEFGKTMDPKKFATAEAFATAIVKAVDDEFKSAGGKAPPEGETDEEREAREAEEAAAGGDDGEDKGKAKPAVRRTDGPGEGDNLSRGTASRRSGPWTKLADAPADIQAEVRRAADKFIPKSATKEQRESYITNALGSHYAAHQRNKGKK